MVPSRLKTKPRDLLKPTINFTYHESVLAKRDQRPSERFDDWLTELKVLVRNCEYGHLEERMLKRRIILGIHDKQL